jgi:predicted Zn-dependent peptidase
LTDTPYDRAPKESDALLLTHKPWLKTTTICVGLARGSRDDKPGQSGAAHLFEHLIMSARGSGTAFTDLVEERGGTTNASSSAEKTLYYARVDNDDAAYVAAQLWRSMTNPQVTESDLSREKNNVVQEISAARADVSDVTQEAFLAELFGSHPLGRPVAGTLEDIAHFSLGDAQSFGAEELPSHYISVVGGIEPERIRDALPPESLVSVRTPLPAAHPISHKSSGTMQFEIPEGEEFVWIAIGGRGVPALHPKRSAYSVLSSILGASSASTLYRQLRDEAGIAYTFEAWPSYFSDAGAWRVLMGVEQRNAMQAIGIVERLLHRIADKGPTAQEHSIAVRQCVGEAQRDAEDPWQLAVNTVLSSDIGRRPWSPERECRDLRRVTPHDIRAAAANVVDDLVVTVRS